MSPQPKDRELEAWDRLGRVAAISLVQSLAELVNEAPPGGIWGREADVHVEVLPKAEAACRAHTERLLFQHPSFAVTGGSCRWDEDPQAPLVEGYVHLRVIVRWPRFEDSPLVKGQGGGKRPVGLSFSPDLIPPVEVPRSILQEGWSAPGGRVAGRTCSTCWFGRVSGEGAVRVCANMDSRKYALEVEPDEGCDGWFARGGAP